jgi:YgiT-type zinc finger domain-containing protein
MAESSPHFSFSRLSCPTCGKKKLIDVVEDVTLSRGRFVPKLAHSRCTACGERLFDPAAMDKIESLRHKGERKRG